METQEPEAVYIPDPLSVSRKTRLITVSQRFLGLVIVLAAIFVHRPWAYWLAVFVWLYIFVTYWAWTALFEQRLRGLFELREEDAPDGENALPFATVIIPARNEENKLEAALRSVAAQDYPAFEAIAINDHSTDATGAIADRVASECPVIRVLHDPALPKGWQGKANAVWQAANLANPASEWLLLTDADVVYHPKALACAIRHALRDGIDFLTIVPYINNGSLLEELLLTLKWSMFLMVVPKDLSKPRARPIGVGPFMLVRKQVYFESGGHRALAGREPEDTYLAALLKQWGAKSAVGWTRGMLRWRQYDSFRQMWRHWVRKNRTSFKDSVLHSMGELTLNLLCLVLPLPYAVAAIWAQYASAAFGVGASLSAALAIALYVTTVRSQARARIISRIRKGAPWLTPLTGILLAGISLTTIAQILTRTSPVWRGRGMTHSAK